MLKEYSNGEGTFEMVDKNTEDSVNNPDKTDSSSGVSSPYSMPSPSGISVPGGNLLSNLPPPSNAQDFTLWQSQTPTIPAPTPLPTNLLPPESARAPIPEGVRTAIAAPFPTPQFSAAIPPSKGIPRGPISQQPSVESNQGNAGLIGWMKDAVATGGILSKVAEKAKHSMDSLITTLDPQMTEFIYSGGDVEIALATDLEDEIEPIRNAIYSVFGKARVSTVNAKTEERKHQAVGFEDGVKRAEEKITSSLQTQKIPTIAVENILLQRENEWFDLSVLVLMDKERHIRLETFTQTTPIPLDLFVNRAKKEIPSYANGCDSTEKLLSAYLQILKNDWQQTLGVSRKETLFLAAKTLSAAYKNKIVVNN